MARHIRAVRPTCGPTATTAGASANVIDQADFIVWRNHFGQTLSGNGSAARSVATAPLQLVTADDGVTSSQYPGLPVADAALASSIVPNNFRSEFGADKPWQLAVARTLTGASVAAVRQDNALLAWLASRTEGVPRHDVTEVDGFIADQAAGESADSRLEAVNEVFEVLSTMPAVGSHQLVNA